MKNNLPILDLASLRAGYASGAFTPTELLNRALDAAQNSPPGVWISLAPRDSILAQARDLESRDKASLPLYGVPFGVKDNIDVEGLATTAACPAFRYQPDEDATVVRLLREAGAVVIGKTNLDQFATGLNGTRSPYGVCHNAFNPEFISGGSSSGSAVAVALGQISFALGTDTAGSGRVPAALNNLVGLKPTRGVWSMRGVVPACRSLDTVSAFALTAPDAELLFSLLSIPNKEDSLGRLSLNNGLDFSALPSWQLGVPDAASLQFFGDQESARFWNQAQEQARKLGAEIVEIDFAPFLEAARLLYDGPWVAERFRVVQALLAAQPDALLPVTRDIVTRGANYSATDAFVAFEQLAALKGRCDAVWKDVQAILTPAIGRPYTIEAMQAAPVQLNTDLGYYTNFMNLLDFSALALPAGLRSDGLPFGVTVFAPAHQDVPVLRFGARWQKAQNLPLGATPFVWPDEQASSQTVTTPWNGAVSVAVCGAHLSDFPLNKQLRERGAKLVAATRTAPKYRFYALPGGPPHRPGLVRVEADGAMIEVEVWSVPVREYGSFVAGIASPLGIGTVELEDGTKVQGFLCEAIAAPGAQDITDFGSWRAWSASKRV